VSFIAFAAMWLRSPFLSRDAVPDPKRMATSLTGYLCLERTASYLTRLEIYEIPYMHCRTLTWSIRFLLKQRPM